MSKSKKNARESSTKMDEVVQNRYDVMVIYDVKDGNSNGDPDAGNLPRTDEETGQAMVSDACLKRMARNAMTLMLKNGDGSHNGEGHEIFFAGEDAPDKERVLNPKMKAAYQKLGLKPGDPDAAETVRKFMCQNHIDIRLFGAVLNTGKDKTEKGDGNDSGSKGKKDDRHNAGNVTGPIQVGIGRSVDKVNVMDWCITRKCVTTEDDAEKQIAKNNQITGTMGRKSMIAYGLFRQPIWISPAQAARTGCTAGDLNLFLKALVSCFRLDRSASKGQRSFRGAYIFEHQGALGSANDCDLFDAIEITKKVEYPRNYSDYKVTIHKDRIPKSVKLHELRDIDQVDGLNLR